MNGALDEKQGSSEDMYRRIFRGVAKARLAELDSATVSPTAAVEGMPMEPDRT